MGSLVNYLDIEVCGDIYRNNR